jgi:hypothetical protein
VEMELLNPARIATVEAPVAARATHAATQRPASSRQTHSAIPAMKIAVLLLANLLPMALSVVPVQEFATRKRYVVGPLPRAQLMLLLPMVRSFHFAHNLLPTNAT